jgi:hypothetical protein
MTSHGREVRPKRLGELTAGGEEEKQSHPHGCGQEAHAEKPVPAGNRWLRVRGTAQTPWSHWDSMPEFRTLTVDETDA